MNITYKKYLECYAFSSEILALAAGVQKQSTNNFVSVDVMATLQQKNLTCSFNVVRRCLLCCARIKTTGQDFIINYISSMNSFIAMVY